MMMTMGAMHVGDGADEESEVGGILSEEPFAGACQVSCSQTTCYIYIYTSACSLPAAQLRLRQTAWRSNIAAG